MYEQSKGYNMVPPVKKGSMTFFVFENVNETGELYQNLVIHHNFQALTVLEQHYIYTKMVSYVVFKLTSKWFQQ